MATELDPREATVQESRPLAVMRPLLDAMKELWQDKAGAFGLFVIILLLFIAFAAPLIAPHDPAAQSLQNRLLPPFWYEAGSWTHPLGTDNLGRDVLSRLIFGSRISLIVGMSVVALAGVFGVVMGLVAGYRGGRTDSFIMRVVDTQISFPGLLLAIILLAVLGPRLTTVIVVLGINGWMIYARVTRGVVLSLRETPYVEAAELVGCRSYRVVFRHILPNLTSPLLTLGILEFARIVLAEAALSFLGIGIQPPQVSWGLDVATGKNYMFNAWWLVTFPGAAIALTVLGVNLMASWLRIVFDPKEREKRFAAAVQSRAMGGS